MHLSYDNQRSMTLRNCWGMPSSGSLLPANLRQPHSLIETVPVPAGEPLANTVRHFFESIARGTPPRSGADAGVRTVQVLEATARLLAGSAGPASEPFARMVASS